jgi:hypothetical protein
MGRWFRYFFGPLFGVLNDQELLTVSQVKSGVRNLERALKAGNQPLSNNGSLLKMKMALDFAEAQITALNQAELSRDVTQLSRDFHRYSDMPEQIAKLRDKTVHLRHQYEFGVTLSNYFQAVRSYSSAVTSQGIPKSWNAFQRARSEMKGMAEDLINKIENDPTLNQKRSIRSMIRNIRTNDSKGGALLKLARHSYPHYEKVLRSLFNVTVQFSRDRFSYLKKQKEYLKPLVEKYHTQVKEVARLEAIINDNSAMGRLANVTYNYFGGNRGQQLATAKEAAQDLLNKINSNKFVIHEEIEWLRNIAETSVEAREIFESIASTMGKIYQINASRSADHAAARESIAGSLDLLRAELKHRNPNLERVNEAVDLITLEIVDISDKYYTEFTLPKNFEKLNDFQKLETLIKVHFPEMENKTAEVASLIKKKRLTQAINTKINESITEYTQARKPVKAPEANNRPDEDEDDDDDVPVKPLQTTDTSGVSETQAAQTQANVDDDSEDSIQSTDGDDDSEVLPITSAVDNVEDQVTGALVFQGDQNRELAQEIPEEMANPENQFDDLGSVIPLASTPPPPSDTTGVPPPPPPPPSAPVFMAVSSTVSANELSAVTLKKAVSTTAQAPMKGSPLAHVLAKGLTRATSKFQGNDDKSVSESEDNEDDDWSIDEDTEGTATSVVLPTQTTEPLDTGLPTSELAKQSIPSVSSESIRDAAPEKPEEKKVRLEREKEELMQRQKSMVQYSLSAIQKRRNDMKGVKSQDAEW